jgi:hypothetical protein
MVGLPSSLCSSFGKTPPPPLPYALCQQLCPPLVFLFFYMPSSSTHIALYNFLIGTSLDDCDIVSSLPPTKGELIIFVDHQTKMKFLN